MKARQIAALRREVASLRATLEAHLFGGLRPRPFSARLSLILDGLSDLEARLEELEDHRAAA